MQLRSISIIAKRLYLLNCIAHNKSCIASYYYICAYYKISLTSPKVQTDIYSLLMKSNARVTWSSTRKYMVCDIKYCVPATITNED